MTDDLMYASVLPASGPDAPLRYEQVPRPVPGPDEVLVKVAAAALDRVDNYIRHGTHGMASTEPQILGRDLAGVVAAVGDDVTDLQVGDEVIALGRATHAQYALAPSRHTLPKPPQWSFVDAAALPTPARTAYDAIVNLAKLRAGERVLVVAAGGAVGSFALQYSVHIGAKVYATAGTDDKCATARAHGAHQTVNHYGPDLVAQVLEASGGAPMDVIIDSVGGPVYERLLRLLAPNGRIVTCGVTAGARTNLHLGKLMTMGWHLYGIGRPDREAVADHLRGCLELLLAAGVKPIVDRTFALSQAQDAHDYLEQSGFFGRIVITTP